MWRGKGPTDIKTYHEDGSTVLPPDQKARREPSYCAHVEKLDLWQCWHRRSVSKRSSIKSDGPETARLTAETAFHRGSNVSDNEHMKRWATTLVIMEIKNFIPTRQLKIKTWDNTSMEEAWSKGRSPLDCGEHTLCLILDTQLALHVKPKHMPTIGPSNSTPSYILFRNLCVCSPGHTYKKGHTVALSVKDPKCKQLKYTSRITCKNKILFTYTMKSPYNKEN